MSVGRTWLWNRMQYNCCSWDLLWCWRCGLRGALNRVFLDLLTGLGLGLDIPTGLGQLGGGRCCKRETSGKLLQSPNHGWRRSRKYKYDKSKLIYRKSKSAGQPWMTEIFKECMCSLHGSRIPPRKHCKGEENLFILAKKEYERWRARPRKLHLPTFLMNYASGITLLLGEGGWAGIRECRLWICNICDQLAM